MGRICRNLVFAAGLSLISLPALGQCVPPVRCPREELRYFMEWDFNGILLQSGGWEKAAVFFRQFNGMDIPPRNPTVAVIDRDYSIDDASISGDKADMYFGFFQLGEIDSMLKWHPADPRIIKYGSIFHMSLSNRRWEKRPDGTTVVHDVRPEQWLIDSGPVGLWVSVDAAIRYVTASRKATADPIIQKNAEATLRVLQKLKR